MKKKYNEIFDEIYYINNLRKGNFLISVSCLVTLLCFFALFMIVLFHVLNFCFINFAALNVTVPLLFLTFAFGIMIGSVIVGVWLFRLWDLRRGITFLIRLREDSEKSSLLKKLNLIPREMTEEEILIWGSKKRIAMGLKILIYVISVASCIVFLIILNVLSISSFLLGLIFTPIIISVLMTLVLIVSMVPTSRRVYHCLSPVFFTSWILKNWTSDSEKPRNTFFQPLYMNLHLLSKNYLNLDIKKIDEIAAQLYSYFLMKQEHSLKLDESNKEELKNLGKLEREISQNLEECITSLDEHIKRSSVGYEFYSRLEGEDRKQFNDGLNKSLEVQFFKLLILSEDIKEYNKKWIGEVSIRFGINWKQRLLNNFSRITLSSTIITVITIVLGLLSVFV